MYKLILTGTSSALGSTGCRNGNDSGSWFHTSLNTGIRADTRSPFENTAQKGHNEPITVGHRLYLCGGKGLAESSGCQQVREVSEELWLRDYWTAAVGSTVCYLD